MPKSRQRTSSFIFSISSCSSSCSSSSCLSFLSSSISLSPPKLPLATSSMSLSPLLSPFLLRNSRGWLLDGYRTWILVASRMWFMDGLCFGRLAGLTGEFSFTGVGLSASLIFLVFGFGIGAFGGRIFRSLGALRLAGWDFFSCRLAFASSGSMNPRCRIGTLSENILVYGGEKGKSTMPKDMDKAPDTNSLKPDLIVTGSRIHLQSGRMRQI